MLPVLIINRNKGHELAWNYINSATLISIIMCMCMITLSFVSILTINTFRFVIVLVLLSILLNLVIQTYARFDSYYD